MANVHNSTNLEQVDGGFLVKQGDVASTFAFSLLDENHMPIPQLEGQEASITLTKDQEQIKKKAIVTQTEQWLLIWVRFCLSDSTESRFQLVDSHSQATIQLKFE